VKALGKQKQRYEAKRRIERYEQERKERKEYLDSLPDEERAQELARESERRSKAMRTFAAMSVIAARSGVYGGKR
jgi:hypothetical protein